MADPDKNNSKVWEEVRSRVDGLASSLPESTLPPTQPPSAAAKAVDSGAKFCPHCGRKLLTQTSALCNWCGVRIEDPEYQERAMQTRQERDTSDRLAVESVIQEEAELGILGSMKRRARQRRSGDLRP